MKLLTPEPLTQAGFAAFGDVLDTRRSDHPTYPINDGYTQRYHALSEVEATAGGVILSIFETSSFGLPLTIRMLERHPFGSQSFIPIGEAANTGFYVVVPLNLFSSLQPTSWRLLPSTRAPSPP